MYTKIAIDFESMDYIKISNNCRFYHKLNKLIVDDEEKDLTAYQITTLKYLIENNGMTMSAEKIYDKCSISEFSDDIYPDDPDKFEKYVEANMYNGKTSENAKKAVTQIIIKLRRLIGPDGKNIIINKKNVGYHIVLPKQDFITKKETDDNNISNNASEDFEKNVFGKELIQNSKLLISNWEEKQAYKIEDNLLVNCIVKEKTYSNLYEYLKDAFSQKTSRNCIILATGGSGKTASLVFICKKFLDENSDVIPIYIQMREVDTTLEKPITSYLYNHFNDKIDFAMPHELENQFLQNLGKYIVQNQKRLLVVLDGCNETKSTKSLKGIKDIIELPNTTIIASSRIKDENLSEFMTVQLTPLSWKVTKEYLKKYNIPWEKFNSENLQIPFFLHMFIKICQNQQDSRRIINSSLNQASIINEWIKCDLEENKKIRHLQDEESEFTIEYFLPILAMTIFLQLSGKEHSSLYVTKSICIRALKEVAKILKEEELKDSIELEKGWEINSFNLNKCLNEIVIKRFAFLQREENEDYLFSWSHECYRDWFIAKGFDVLRRNSERLSREYLTKFVTETFKYPAVFKNKDYSAYAVAVYFAELVGEADLIRINDVLYHDLIRNIIFFADDIGNTKTVLDYSAYIKKRDANQNIETPKLQRAKALSGIAASILHIYNVTKREDTNEIIENALEMLEESKKCIAELFGFTFDDIISNQKNITEISPKEVEQLYKKLVVRKQFKEFEKLKQENDFYFYDALACFSRIYGNYGSYYINKYDANKDKDKKMLSSAFSMHFLGGLLKYYIIINKPTENVGGVQSSEAMSVAYRSLGVDLFRLKNYKNSVAFFTYAKENFAISKDAEMILEEYIIRSKVADILEGNYEDSMQEIIKMETSLVLYFKETKKIGELERILYVVADMIAICKKMPDAETEKELLQLIELLDEICENFYIEENLKKKMLKYWHRDGKNLWEKSFA